MDGAFRPPSRLARCRAVVCALAAVALGSFAAAQGPQEPTLFAAPESEAPVGAESVVPPMAGQGMTGPGMTGPTMGGPGMPAPMSCATAPGEGFAPSQFGGPWEQGPSPRPWILQQFDLRHSSTHGRAMGPGDPLRGTSWLNRPVSVSLDFGAFLMGDRPAENVRAGNDVFGAIGLGWDWDHYWGSQLRVGWSTPELLNTTQTDLSDDDNLLVTDLSLLYYPWGDSRMRPYWRVGVGLTDIEYVNDLGRRNQDMLFTIPFGVGVKYQVRRHLAWRLELMDNLAIGQNETGSMNNFTITTGFEWRLGGRPEGYGAWAPRGGGW